MQNLKSPFRYPGGKSKLSPYIVNLVKNEIPHSLFANNISFIDVFTGGGSVFIKFIESYPRTTLILNDLDEWIYSFWQAMGSSKETNRLLYYLKKYEQPSIDDFNFLRKSSSRKGLKDGYKAFLAIFFNRTTFSGIFSSGPIGGYSQEGSYKMDCRYNYLKLRQSIISLNYMFDIMEVDVLREDFKLLLDRYKDKDNIVIYLDPPYMKQGEQLYNHFLQPNEYQIMSDMLKTAKSKWIVSHDNHPALIEMFKWANIREFNGVPCTINSIKGKKCTELLITNF